MQEVLSRMEGPDGIVVAVSHGLPHLMAQTDQACIGLLAGLGVEDDTQMDEKVRHPYPVKHNPRAAEPLPGSP
jgi:hypothetical protein